MSVYQEIDAAESLPEVHAISVTLVDWFRDIASYDTLTADCEAIRCRQTELMERIRTSQTEGKPAAYCAVPTLPDLNTRPSTRFAALIPTTKRAKFKTTTRRKTKELARCMIGGLKTELDLLDLRLASTRQKMRELAARVMTFEPKGPHEAVALVRFIARICQTNDKIDTSYMSDVLDSCADALNTRFKLKEQTVH